VSQALTSDDREYDLQPDAEGEAVASLLTYGDPIRSWVRLVEPVAEEIRVRFDADGMHVRAVDPANVSMVDLTAHADGFPKFEIESGTTVGVDLDKFSSAVGWARKRGEDGDPVGIDVFTDPPRIRVSITRPDQSMKRISEWFLIDPESLREAGEIPSIKLPNRADPEVRALSDAVDAIDESHDHVDVTRSGDTLELSASNDAGEESIYMPGCAWDDRADTDAEPVSAKFSTDYLVRLATGLRRGKADRVTLAWGEDHPVRAEFVVQDWGFDGTYLVAPRVHKDGEDS
jgi:proliferating cell nuclear antigen